MLLSGHRPDCILPTGSWEGSCLNRSAKGVICLPSTEHYEVITGVKPSYIYISDNLIFKLQEMGFIGFDSDDKKNSLPRSIQV